MTFASKKRKKRKKEVCDPEGRELQRSSERERGRERGGAFDYIPLRSSSW